MATKDKIVNLEDLKVSHDDLDGKVSDLKSEFDHIWDGFYIDGTAATNYIVRRDFKSTETWKITLDSQNSAVVTAYDAVIGGSRIEYFNVLKNSTKEWTPKADTKRITVYFNGNGVIRFSNEDQKNHIVGELEQKVSVIDSEVNVIENCFPNDAFSEGEYNAGWTQGGCSSSGVIDTTNTARIHTDYIPIDYVKNGGVESGSTQQYWARIFSSKSQSGFLGNGEMDSSGNVTVGSSPGATSNPIDFATIKTAFPTAKYVILVVKKSDGSNLTPNDEEITITGRTTYNGVSLDDVYKRQDKPGAYSTSEIVFMYPIANGYQSKGFLKLPPNYSAKGNKVPLIVFCHGSGDVQSIYATTMTANYQDYYNYLRDNGFAIFDCYGWGTKYTAGQGGTTNTYGLPINRNCYLSGIEYVTTNWNIDKNQIFVASKSLGGIQAMSFLHDPNVNVQAVGMLAPELCPFTIWLGYEAANKKTFAAELGFSEDTGNVLNFNQGTNPPEGFWDYIWANEQQWSGAVTIYSGIPMTSAEKQATLINNFATAISNAIKTMPKMIIDRPVKIWIAEDDINAPYIESEALIKALNNGGGYGVLRTMPNNTGGHHSVDTDANAPQKTDVTTALGIHYDSIPLAYYELGEWFKQWLTK